MLRLTRFRLTSFAAFILVFLIWVVVILWFSAVSAQAQSIGSGGGQAAQSMRQLNLIPSPNSPGLGSIRIFSPNQQHSIGISAASASSVSDFTQNMTWYIPHNDIPGGGCFNTDGSGYLSVGLCGGANTETVSDAHPLTLYCPFTDEDSNHIRFKFSMDYANFKSVRPGGFPITTTEARDNSCVYYAGEFLIVSSPTPTASNLIQIFNSQDGLHNINPPVTIDCTTILSGCNASYAPQFFVNPTTIDTLHPQGRLYLITTNSNNGGTSFHLFINEFNPYTGTLVLPLTSEVTLPPTSSGQNRVFDAYLYYDQDLYVGGVLIRTGSHKFYLSYVDEFFDTSCTSGSTYSDGRCFWQGWSYAVSNSMLGPYSASGNTPPKNSSNVIPYSNWDYGKFSPTSEGFTTLMMPNGCMRIFSDTWVDLFDYLNTGLNPRQYLPQYIDSCAASGADPFSNIISLPTPIQAGQSEHADFYAITDPLIANKVLQAAAFWRNDNYLDGRVAIGGTQSPFAPYDLTIFSKFAQGFIQNYHPPSIALGGLDPYAVAQPFSFGVLSGCGTDPRTCPASLGGEGTFIVSTQGKGMNGIFQLNNTNFQSGKIGEVSIGFQVGQYRPGAGGNDPQLVPVTSGGFGAYGAYKMGMRDPCFGPLGLDSSGKCQNTAETAFTIFNYGLGGFPLSIKSSTGEVGFNYGIKIGIGNGSTYAASVNLDSQINNVLNCGDGTVAHINCIFKAGVFDFQSVLRSTGSDLTSGLGTSTKWIRDVNTAGTVAANHLTLSGTDGTGTANYLQAGSGYIGNVLGFGNNFNPSSPYSNLTASSSGTMQLNTGSSTDRNGIFSTGYFDALNLYSVHSGGTTYNGLTAAIGYVNGCSYTTITYKNASGVNQSTTVCTGVTSATLNVTGGILR